MLVDFFLMPLNLNFTPYNATRAEQRMSRGRNSYKATAGAKTRYRRTAVPYKGIGRRYLDTSSTDTSLAATGVVANLNTIPEGTNQGERSGRTVHLTSLHLRAFVNMTSANTHSGYRIMLVHSINTPGANPTPAQILETPTSCMTTFRNINNTMRYKILYDLTDRIVTGTTTGAAGVYVGQPKYHEFNYKFSKPLRVDFDDSVTTGVVASQTSGSLCLMMFSEVAEAISLTVNVRVRYVDQ